ncbi:MAG: thiamine-phosphate kinase [Helicobacteraceae bacterium]|jgi:thiamine-monophosphate kinase|nr:thiamine-phosphate kinase [Helicobacteraceae bacterium]
MNSAQKEFDIIEKLAKRLTSADESILSGIGDDCACAAIGGELLLIANDDMRENVHFKRHFPPRDVGYKLIIANVSDILACGGVPKWINLSIGFPSDLDFGYLAALYDGINEALLEFKIAVTGGDTTRCDSIQLGATILGTTTRFVSRGGASIGDYLFLSAPLGKSRLGLEALLRGELCDPFAKAHLRPKLAIALAPIVAKYAASAIDVSDGFLGDAGHLIRASGVGFEIDNPQGLIAPEVFDRFGDFDAALEFALNSGEEYRLLFTATIEERERFLNAGAILLGRAVKQKTLTIEGKQYNPIGFSHF